MNDELDNKLVRMIYLEELIQRVLKEASDTRDIFTLENSLRTAVWLREQREKE